MGMTMQRLQISLPEWQYRFLQEQASRTGQSIAGLICNLIEQEARAVQRPMDGITLLDQINRAKEDLGIKCSKYAGAITVQFVRRAFREHGISASPRDVFIKGVPIEIDLLIPRAGTSPENGILYRPEDVLIALEIKNSGAFGEGAIRRIRKNFMTIQQHNKQIRCFYVTLAERKGYKWAVTEDNLGFPAYTLFWHSGSSKNRRYEPSGDLQRLINDISSEWP